MAREPWRLTVSTIVMDGNGWCDGNLAVMDGAAWQQGTAQWQLEGDG